ncbi:MAG: 1,4-alpha-glucan branching protein domain-containing protein [Armatimonadia bacterium]
MSQPFGALCFILHGHIPYVLGHSTWPHGSNMIYEAAADTYIPLLWAVEELAYEGIPMNITLGLTPIVMEQLDDDRFKHWFPDYLEHRCWKASDNIEEFRGRGDEHLAWLAGRWQQHFEALLDSYLNRYNRDLLGQFRTHQEAGNLEIMGSAATHGYLPLLHEDGSIQGQIMQGIATYEKFMGRPPRGFWLPECAYRPRCMWASPLPGDHEQPYPRKGLEEFLGENGVDYFVVDSHMAEGGGDPLPVRIEKENTLGKAWSRIYRTGDYAEPKTVHRPYFVGSRFEDHPPVACLFRDPGTSKQVWSGDIGYPGDYNYLDFHKKHMPGDHRYWRVTDAEADLGSKEVYVPEWADERVKQHAGNFLYAVKETLRNAPHHGGKLPAVIAPFDAELFGHWWFEGPRWLTHVVRWMHHDPDLKVMTGSNYVREEEPNAALALPEGSWGEHGGHFVWNNDRTQWVWHRIYDAEQDYQALLRDHGPGHDCAMCELVSMAGRQLLLLQASDWPFLINNGTAIDYASQRLVHHHDDYKRVADMARRYGRGEYLTQEEWDWFGDLKDRERPFPDLDPCNFGQVKNPAHDA